MASGATSNNSVQGFVTVLIVNGLIFLAFLGAFLILRNKYQRVYQPKTFISSVPKSQQTEPLPPSGSWIPSLLRTKDVYILEKSGLDSYFFLRYIRVIAILMFVGCCLTWPVLFPVNATGGAGKQGLDILTFSNVAGKGRYWAHLAIAYIFIVFFFYMIQKELRFFVSLRQSHLAPYADSEAACTVLISSVPEKYRDEQALASLFGPQVRNVTIARNYSTLDELVTERTKVLGKLEAAETKLLRTAIKNHIKNGNKEPSTDESNPAVIDRLVPCKKRPTHRLKFLIGKKVDTIDWCRERLATLNAKIRQARTDESSFEPVNSAFVTFKDRASAQAAAQTTLHHTPMHMTPRYTNIRREEIIWANLRILWWERVVRAITTTAIIAAMVLFWAIPVTFVGFVSNIQTIIGLLPFLSFIRNLPKQLQGLINGLLPTVLLAVLMALVPILMRKLAFYGGAPTLSSIELKVQNSYFAFLVVQVFFVTAIASSAISVIQKISNDAMSVTSILAQNLPKSSNFYISYVILQGLSISGGVILQLVGLILFFILGRVLDNTPRKMFTRWMTLNGVGWGTLFPGVSILGVISLTYSIISPLLMGFTFIGFLLLYFAYLYNFLYVYEPTVDTTGIVYARALKQLTVGIYLMEVCMIGLFAVAASVPHIVLMVIALVFTVLFHLSLNQAIDPMIEALPQSTVVELNSKKASMEDNATLRSETTATANEKSRQYLPTDDDSSTVRHRSTAQFNTGDVETISDKDTRPTPGFVHPAMSAPEPWVWLPRDPIGLSQTEVTETRKARPSEETVGLGPQHDDAIHVSDQGAFIDNTPKANIYWQSPPPDYVGPD